MSAQMTPNELQNLLKKQNQGRHFEFAYVHRHTEKKNRVREANLLSP